MNRPTAKSMHRRAGVTLLEVMLSIAIVSALLVGIVSMMFVAQRAVASNVAVADSLRQESQVAQMVNLDLSLATAFTERTDKAVTMTVPDRNGDGQPETIRYAWSGTPGDPLTRQVNGGAVVVVVTACYQFKLIYLVKTLSVTLLDLDPFMQPLSPCLPAAVRPEAYA